MLLAGGQGGFLAHQECWSSVNPISTSGWDMPTTFLLAHPDFET